MSESTLAGTLSQLIFSKNPKKVDFGVEIEMEGRGLSRFHELPEVLDYWKLEADGSLQNGIELVLRQPVKFNKLEERLNNLKTSMKNNCIKINSSDRTGVHLHLNVGDFTPLQLVNFLCCYYILEESIVETCGENRIGNHFCLRAIDAEYVINLICQSMSSKNESLYSLRDDIIRYSALNLCSLFKFGTVEYRAIQTTPNFVDQIVDIANVLMSIKQNSQQFLTPNKILEEFSGNGVSGFLEKVLPDEKYREMVIGNRNTIESRARTGMYMAQDIAYSTRFSTDFNWGLGTGSLKKKTVDDLLRIRVGRYQPLAVYEEEED